jgi:SSS family solute:Na+ symporter
MPSAIGWIDLLVLGTSLVLVVVVGLKARGQVRNVDGYLLGDRNLPWWAILGSIVATETSTATVLSVPGIGYSPTGMRFLQIALGYVVGRAVVVRVLLPLYFQGRLFTAYQVLEQRFGPHTRRAASALFLVTRNLSDGLRLFLAALVLQQLAGWPFAGSLVVMGAVTICYTYFGGMRSVVWNDCLQFVIYMLGAVATVFVIAAHLPGGWPEWWQFAHAHDRLRVLDFKLSWSDPYNFWAGLFGGAMLTIGTHGTDHMMVQRYLSARSQRDAGRAVVVSGIVVLAQFALFLLIGVGLASYYAHRPEVVFERDDQVFAHFLVHEFPPNTGLIGLLLAAILAAAMSTLSSSLNSSAAALMKDFYLPARTTPLSPDRELALTRAASLLFGLIQMGVGWGATRLTSSVVANALTIAGFSAGLLLGVYALGVLTRHVGQTAAIAGAGVGLVVLGLLQFGQPLMAWLHPLGSEFTYTRLAWPWLSLVGATTTFAAGLLFQTLLSPRSGVDS